MKIKELILLLILTISVAGCLVQDSFIGNDKGTLDTARTSLDQSRIYLEKGDAREASKLIHRAKRILENDLRRSNTEGVALKWDLLDRAHKDLEWSLTYLDEDKPNVTKAYLLMAREEIISEGLLEMGENVTARHERFSVVEMEMPLTYYGYVDGVYIGYQVVAHTVAEMARNAFYNYSQTGSKEELEKGLSFVDYLILTATPRGGGDFIVWENNFVWPVYDLPPGWIGSLSQAGSMKAILLAYDATGEPRYLEWAQKALNAFQMDVSKGGLRMNREDGTGSYIWYPEYAEEEPPFVLNGFITSVVWLNDYYELTGDGTAQGLAAEGLISISHFLPTYQRGADWSYYDALGNPSSDHYHELHVLQMGMLYNLTGEDIYREYMESWVVRNEES